MTEAISLLTHALTGKERLQDCNADELRQMVRLYPFFGPAHILLAKKAKEEHDGSAADIIAKASLFVPNELWFDRLLKEEEVSAGMNDYEKTTHHTVVETPATVEEVIEQPSESDTTDASDVLPEETVLEEPATYEEVIKQSPETDTTDPSAVLPTETVLEEPATQEEVIQQSFTAQTDAPINGAGTTIEPSNETEENETEPGTPPATNEQQQVPGLAIPSLKIEPIDPGKIELSFQPYHTVDYFASQGIRFRDEEKPKDRLGQQLKSFTEWLKVLKKVPASGIPAAPTRQEEKKVEQMAQVSISDREVVTEAMAEVWEKQGNAVKALELYEKLSLLDPAKSAYFAAKIEHLKQL